MPTEQAIQIPAQVASYLLLHHIVTIGTSSITGMPHAATTAYASGDAGVYFSMRPDELTVQNVAANHWASFTIDDYTPDFRKVRELRGVGRCGPVEDPAEQEAAVRLFSDKFRALPAEALTNLHRITPLVLDFVDFEYTAGVAVPRESSIVYEASPEATRLVPANFSAQLETLQLAAGQVIVRQGDRTDRFFIIVDGEVEVRREGHGQDVVVTRHGPGQLFGEAGALTGAPQSATFVAATPATVLAVDRSAFQSVVTQSAGADLTQRVRQALDDNRGPGLPPAGWYADPAGRAAQRYWTGEAWTAHTR
jgi:nitroimidazol reductase NimA-like FMN-containing flavoprotein (pyridoxamine 5'-phosphate oxidase superfamily)